MPSYVYRCPQCEAERQRNFWPLEYRDDLPECLMCGVKMDRVLYPPALRFNGEGWQTPKPVKEGEK
jgi:predicted nucleic acid-binding Zn ribbon protein